MVGIQMLRFYVCRVTGDSSGGAQPHYQVFLELRGVRNLTEEQRYKVRLIMMWEVIELFSHPGH